MAAYFSDTDISIVGPQRLTGLLHRLTWISLTTSWSSASAKTLMSCLLITLLKSANVKTKLLKAGKMYIPKVTKAYKWTTIHKEKKFMISELDQNARKNKLRVYNVVNMSKRCLKLANLNDSTCWQQFYVPLP